MKLRKELDKILPLWWKNKTNHSATLKSPQKKSVTILTCLPLKISKKSKRILLITCSVKKSFAEFWSNKLLKRHGVNLNMLLLMPDFAVNSQKLVLKSSLSNMVKTKKKKILSKFSSFQKFNIHLTRRLKRFRFSQTKMKKTTGLKKQRRKFSVTSNSSPNWLDQKSSRKRSWRSVFPKCCSHSWLNITITENQQK